MFIPKFQCLQKDTNRIAVVDGGIGFPCAWMLSHINVICPSAEQLGLREVKFKNQCIIVQRVTFLKLEINTLRVVSLRNNW